MTFYIRLAFTSGLALRIKGAAYFTKPQLSETDNTRLLEGTVTVGVAICYKRCITVIIEVISLA
jgi:hypothetical protein